MVILHLVTACHFPLMDCQCRCPALHWPRTEHVIQGTLTRYVKKNKKMNGSSKNSINVRFGGLVSVFNPVM